MNQRILIAPCLAALLLALAACGSGSTAVDTDYEITMSASYNRQAESLSLELLHSADANINISFIAPIWISLQVVQTRELADGRLIMDLNVVLADALDNVGQVTIIATDDYDTRETRDLVIHRPVYISDLSAVPDEDGVTVDVTIDAPGTNAVGVTLTPPAGFTVLESAEQTGSGNSMYTFELAYPPEVVLGGGSGSEIIHLRAFDDLDHEFFQQVIIEYDVTALEVPAGALAAVPLRSLAHVGEPLTIAVVSGDFTAEQPFYDLRGCGVTMTGGAGFVAGSFNCGFPGGEYDDVDGIWSGVQALSVDTGGVPAPERVETGDGGYRFDFQAAPAGGSATTSGGVLFTFDVTFAEDGMVALGIQEFEHVSRTYYGDGMGGEYHWADTSNNYTSVANTVTVVK